MLSRTSPSTGKRPNYQDLIGKYIEIHTSYSEFPIFRGTLTRIFPDNSIEIINENVEHGTVRIRTGAIKKIYDLSC